MSDRYLVLPQKGVPIYATAADLPISAQQGSLAVTADTGQLYEFNGAIWVLIAGPNDIPSPGGAQGAVQYNNAGAFAGSSAFTFDGSDVNLLGAANLNFNGNLQSTNLGNIFGINQIAFGTGSDEITGGSGSIAFNTGELSLNADETNTFDFRIDGSIYGNGVLWQINSSDGSGFLSSSGIVWDGSANMFFGANIQISPSSLNMGNQPIQNVGGLDMAGNGITGIASLNYASGLAFQDIGGGVINLTGSFQSQQFIATTSPGFVGDGSGLTGVASGFTAGNADEAAFADNAAFATTASSLITAGVSGALIFNSGGFAGPDEAFTNGSGDLTAFSYTSMSTPGFIGDGSGITGDLVINSLSVSGLTTIDIFGNIGAANYSASNGFFFTTANAGIITNGNGYNLVDDNGIPIITVDNGVVGFFGTTPVSQQSGDIGVALVNLGLMSSANPIGVSMTLSASTTATFNTGGFSQTIYDTSTTLITALTIALPSTTVAGQILRYVSNRTVTTTTVTGTVLVGAPPTLAANSSIAYQAVNTTGSFIRIQ